MEKTAKVLAAGAGHLYGTSLPVGGTNTHAVISAHTGYDRLMFDRLSLGQGHVGDRFTIEVLGHTLAYRVTDIRVIDPDDFSVFGIEAGKDEVSLLTCTPYGVNTRRLVVTGERVDIPDPAPAPDDVPLARPGWWLLAAVGVAMALTGAMVLAAVPAGLAAAAAPAYVSAALSKVADGTGHGTPNQTFVNAANGFEVGDNAPDDGVVSSGDLVLYRLDLGFTAASARTVRVRWDLADAPYLEGGTEFCYSGAQVTASVQDDGSCVFTVPAGVAESVSRQIVLRMPANEDDKAMRGEGCSSEEPDADGCTGPDGSWHDYSGAYSRYHGGWSLEEPVTLSDADSTPTQVRYSVDPVFSGNADDYTWLTWDQLQALEPSRRTVTAVELVSEFSALDEDTLTLAAANGTINLRTKGNRPDDTYVMWVGTPQFSHPDDGVQPTAPFPAQVATVASSISGTLYNVVAGRMANVGDRKFVDVDTGFRHGMLLQDDGTVWNFGTNASGQLGVTGGNHQPTPVDGIQAKAIAAGVYGEYIVALDGTVYASGTNGDGQLGRGFLGDGDEGRQHVFQPVEGLKASRVWAGEHSAVALGEDGRMYAWGGNGSRQLGRAGSAATVPEPFAGTIPGTPVEVSIGAKLWWNWEHIMMLQDDGTIIGWGHPYYGVLVGTQSRDPSQPVTVEARGSQATPATDPTAQDVAPVSERNETRADGGRDVVRAYTLPAAVAPGGRVVLLAGAGVLLRRR